MIVMDGVRLTAGNRELLRGITAEIPAGTLTCVLGPNGVGKTTMLRAMAGIGARAGGTLAIGCRDVATLGARERARTVAYVGADDAILDALTVADVVSIGRYSHHRWWEWQERPSDERAVTRALAAVEMEAFASRQFTTLSSGERQRVWIALGLAQESPVLLLDEPTSHLDVRVAHAILRVLREVTRSGTTVVCVLHDLNEAAAYADNIALLGCGTLLAYGAPRNVLAAGPIERAYGITMAIIETPHGPRIFPA